MTVIKDKESEKKICKHLANKIETLEENKTNTIANRKLSNTENLSNNTNDYKTTFNNTTYGIANQCSPTAKNKTGSLYQMFTSNIFDINWVICYLDKRDEIGIFDTLINIMQTKHVDESIFYLPQLCTILTYKINTESLEDYILDRCVNQIKFSLRIFWLIGSYLENAENEKISKIYSGILQKLEETLVNGRRCTMSNYVKYNTQLMMESIEIYKQSIDKELRLKYFDLCVVFYKQLKEMCEKLKNFPREKEFKNNRNIILKDYIFMFNSNLNNLRTEYKANQADLKFNNSTVRNFYKGVILPFDDCISTKDEDNSLIVRIIPEYSFCFSTKARVPVKLCVECVKVYECEKWKELLVEDSEEDDKNKAKLDKEVKIPLNNENDIINELNTNIFKIDESKFMEHTNYSNTNYDIVCEKSLDEYMLELQLKEDNNRNMTYKIHNTLNDHDKNSKIVESDLSDSNLNLEKNVISFSSDNSNLTSKQDKMSDSFVMIEYNPQMLNVFGKKWTDIQKELKEKSPYRKFTTYTLKNFMAKADDDLRQELMTMQLIKKFSEVFQKAEINLKIRTYEILITSSTSGLIEFIPNTNSIDGIKKKIPQNWNLKSFYKNFFLDAFEEAQKNFAESLAAYSLICYYLQIKDRHNGNILIDMNGYIIHIDFGFILGISPGNLNFENAPFKMTEEYVEILDGPDSPIFEYYKSLMLRGMLELRKNVDVFVKIVEIMSKGNLYSIIYPS